MSDKTFVARSKYSPLYAFLKGSSTSVIYLSFVEIERILGDQLPPSARRRPEWWANESPGGRHVQARAWLDAHRKTEALDLRSETVEFVR